MVLVTPHSPLGERLKAVVDGDGVGAAQTLKRSIVRHVGLCFHLLRGQPLCEVNCEVVARLQSYFPFLGHLAALAMRAVLAA